MLHALGRLYVPPLYCRSVDPTLPKGHLTLTQHVPAAAAMQVSESGSGGGGLFAGILAILDPELPFEERQR